MRSYLYTSISKTFAEVFALEGKIFYNTAMKLKVRSILTYALGWPLSVAAIIFLAKTVFTNTSGIFIPGKTINFFMLSLGLFCFLAYFFLRGYLWQQILSINNHQIALKKSLWLWGYAELKRFVPGNIWSIVGRVTLFSKEGIEKKQLASFMLYEAILFVASCLLLSLFCLFYIFNGYLSYLPYHELIAYSIFALVILATVFFIFNNTITKRTGVVSRFIFNRYLFLQLSPYKNARLLAISCAGIFFFGLGTYITISSIVFLTPQILFTFIGFFIFSLLFGYISFITPMGLGVREGIITFGLATLMSISMSSFSALFARIILIVSEIVFLVIVYFWQKTKSKIITSTEKWITKHIHLTLLLLAICIYSIYFSGASFLRHDNFYTGRFDLGNMSQTVWNTAHGRVFQLTDPNGTEIMSRLNFHADFILVLLAPFQIIWSNPKMLLLLQSIVIGFGALFIYLLCNLITSNKTVSLFLGLAFLLNPSINYANLFDFHAVTLATTLLLATMYFLIQKKYIWFVVFALLSALTKEQVWTIIFLLGLYIVCIQRKIVFGVIVSLVSFAAFYFLVWYAIPQVRGSGHFALTYFADFGSDPSGIIKNVIFSPLKTLSIIFQKDQITYLFQLLSPLGFLSLLSPLSLIFAFPDLLINLLSNNSQLHQIYFQYTATITPFIFISSMYAIKKLQRSFSKISPKVYITYFLITTVATAYFFGPLPGAVNPNLDMFTKPEPKKETIRRVLAQIPKNESVAATNNLGSHLSNREKIYTIPNGIDKADFVAFLLDDSYAQPSLGAQIKMATDLKNNNNYQLVYEQDDFIVFKKL